MTIENLPHMHHFRISMRGPTKSMRLVKKNSGSLRSGLERWNRSIGKPNDLGTSSEMNSRKLRYPDLFVIWASYLSIQLFTLHFNVSNEVEKMKSSLTQIWVLCYFTRVRNNPRGALHIRVITSASAQHCIIQSHRPLRTTLQKLW